MLRLEWLKTGLAAAAVLAIVSGCASAPPKRPAPNRPDGDSETGMVNPVPDKYLDELTTKTVQWLAVEMPRQPDVKASQNQFVFGVPQTLDTSGLKLPDGRMRETLERIKSELQDNKNFRESFVVISSTEADAKAQIGVTAGKDLSPFRDPLQRTPDHTTPARFDPQFIYTMSGRFYENVDSDEGQRSFHLFIRVDRTVDRARIADHDVVIKLRWDGRKGKWVRDGE